MAVIVRILVDAAGQSDHDRLQSAVENRLQDVGGPPEALMVHLGYPDDRGLVIVEAWRSEDAFRSYLDHVLGGALRDVGLVAGEPDIVTAWSIARP
jgi:hypothetical protein